LTWKTKLRKPSFRGVPFFVNSSEMSGGRRIVEFEFPERDDPATEDLGRKKRDFSLECYVIGDDYFELRDALIAALELEKTPGELVHPFYGERTVRAKDFKVRESMTTDGRMAVFNIEFTEAGLMVDPSSSVDTKSSILSSAAEAKKKSESKFAKVFSIANQPGFVISKAQAKIDSAASVLEKSPVKGAAQGIAEFTGKIKNLKFTSAALMQRPSDLGAYLGSSISGLQGVSGTKGESYKPYLALAAFGTADKATYSDNETGAAEEKNDKALNSFIQEQALINSVETVIENSFDSYNEADSNKGFLIDIFDRLLDTNEDDELYIALGDLKAIFIQNFPLEGEDLPSISKYKTISTIPSLVLSYQLYGDARREDEIVKRNKISNPAFIPGGMELEVLNE
jgi:prophage DNA circulation protein